MPRTEEQFEEIRQNRRRQIMDVALEVFATDGYHRASISKIATQAGISKGLLYNYFDSKKDLLLKILEDGSQRLQEVFKQIEDDLDTPEEMMIFIKGTFDIMRQDSHFYTLMFTVMFQPGAREETMIFYERIIGDMMEKVAFYFKQKGDPYPMEKAYVLGAVLDGIGLQYMIAPEMFDLEKLEKVIFDLFK